MIISNAQVNVRGCRALEQSILGGDAANESCWMSAGSSSRTTLPSKALQRRMVHHHQQVASLTRRTIVEEAVLRRTWALRTEAYRPDKIACESCDRFCVKAAIGNG